MNSFVLFGYLTTFACGWLNVVIVTNFAPFTATHHTGSVTKIPVSFLDGDWFMFFALIGLASAFIIGVAISAFINPRGDGNFTSRFGYAYITGAVVLAVFAAAFGLSYWFIFYCSVFAGFQNGFLSQFKLRVSHMSGVSTDAGVELGRMCKEALRRGNPNRKSILKSYAASFGLKMLFIAVFATGALVGALISIGVPLFVSFLLLAIFDTAIAIFYLRICPYLRTRRERESVENP